MGQWTLHLDSVFALLNARCQGLTISDPTGQLSSTRVNGSYVDDTYVYAQPGIPEKLIPRVDPNEDFEDFDSDCDDELAINPGRLTVQNLKRNVQEFTDGMQLIGQHMAFHKCSYQVLTWVNERGRLVPHRKAWINVSKPVRANPLYMTSFRAKMAGLLDMLQYIDKHNMHNVFFTLRCDNKACVDILSSKEDPYLTDLSSSEADLIQAARKIIKRCPNMAFQHVLGHQDDRDGPESDRPVEVQLNIECDKEAGVCQRQEWPASFRPTAPEGTGAMLYLNDDMVTTEMDEQIQYAAHGLDSLTYVRDKYEWTDNNILSINWKAIRESKNRLDTSDNIRISKLMHGWLNVGR
ncbi:hypothetical protein ACHAWF_010492 [Thalassiosira exigua]